MTTLRNLVLAAATAAAALAAGASAQAQDFRPGGYDPAHGYRQDFRPAAYGYAGGYGRESRDTLRDRIQRLERRLDWAVRSDRLPAERGYRLSADLRDLWRADGRDLNRIDAQLDGLEDRLNGGRGYDDRRW